MTDLHRLRQTEIATLLGLSARQVHNLVQEQMPGVTTDGSRRWYDGPVCVRWYWERKLAAAVAEAAPPDTFDAQARLATVNAELKELELAERRGQLLPADYAAAQHEAMAELMKTFLTNLPGKMAPRLMGAKTIAQMQDGLTRAVNEALDALSQAGSDASLDPADPEGAAA